MGDEMNEIWSLYADDGEQALNLVEEALLRLKENSADSAAIARLFRGMHTFKGNARLLGLAVIESRTHLGEDLIGLVRDEGVPLDAELLGLLLEAADALRGMLEESVSKRRDVPEAGSEALFQRMKDKFERCKLGEAAPVEAPLDVPAEAPPAEAEPEPEPEPELVNALLFKPEPTQNLADDPVYRQIFREMAQEVIDAIRATLGTFEQDPNAAQSRISEELERLRHAANQIGMTEWLHQLDAFCNAPCSTYAAASECAAALEALQEQNAAKVSGAEAVTHADPLADLFLGLEPLLPELATLDPWFRGNAEAKPEKVSGLASEIEALAARCGFDAVADCAAGLRDACNNPPLARRNAFRIYEKLARIEESAGSDGGLSRTHARTMLRSWCANHAFETIIELKATVEAIRGHKAVAEGCECLSAMLREMHYACEHYGIDTGGHVAMALVDLFERLKLGDSEPDPVLMHLAKSFVATLELVFSSVNSGETPDLMNIEALLRQAEEVTFVTAGTVTAASIERRLGLPKSFHRVLTPESVKLAVTALDARHHFYIVNADLNEHEKVAQDFLTWITSGAATSITNVTRFDNGATAFDFLLSSPLDEPGFAAAISTLDPSGKALRLEMTLSDHQAGRSCVAAKEAEGTAPAANQNLQAAVSQDFMSRSMLEAIGEIVTGHALARHMLAELAEEETMQIIEAEMRAAGGEWTKAREMVSQRLRARQDRIERLVQEETQLADRLDRLQEEAIAVRSRPAALLLKPLAAFGETLARNHQRQVNVSTAGDDIALDFSMLESFKSPLHTLVSFAATESIEPVDVRARAGKPEAGRIHIALAKNDDHVAITLEDDGRGFDMGHIEERARQLGWREPPSIDMVLREGFGRIGENGEGVDFAEVRRGLRLSGGDLRIVKLLTGGVRFHATLPLAMVVLDGMVVRVGEVTYVVPIDAIQLIVHPAASAMMKVSAGGGGYMLKLDNDDVLPVRFLMRDGERHNVFGKVPGDFFQADGGDAINDGQKRLFVVAGNQSNRVALSIDELIGQQLVLIRPLQGYLSGIRGVTGCALLGSGGVGMVVDMGFVLNQSRAA